MCHIPQIINICDTKSESRSKQKYPLIHKITHKRTLVKHIKVLFTDLEVWCRQFIGRLLIFRIGFLKACPLINPLTTKYAFWRIFAKFVNSFMQLA